MAKESKAEVERTFNIPLRKGFRNVAEYKKTPKAMRTLKEFLAKHMKSENIKLGPELNKLMWERGIKNPPHHVKVHAVRKDGVVKVELEGVEYKEAVKDVKETKEEKKEVPKAETKTEAKPEVKAEEKPEPKAEVKQEAPKAEKPKAPKAAPKKAK